MSSRMAEVERFARQLGKLQASQGVTRKLLSLTASADYDMREVVNCLERDPVLAVRILRVVNSSRYGLRHKVSSIRQAAALLGQRSLRLFALSFSIVGNLTNGPHKQIYADYWRRSMTMATAASELARFEEDVPPEDAYTAGILADVAILIFIQYDTDTYAPAYESCLHGPELIAAERDLFKVGHPELGARFLTTWAIPDSAIRAVARHHSDEYDMEEPLEPLDRVIRAADLITASITEPEERSVRQASEFLQKNFAAIDMPELVSRIYDETESCDDLFGTGCRENPPKEAVLNAWNASLETVS
ncbi:HDOD domain-containing protein [Calycomorphotria hydatis]|uniref:HDOD domain protein n=1 Tax=Calycomorphotria hydatis TaxID=2528027 RepID=A0A517T3M1_9PLAN|nr:HDOD domain-containing protein [Calycomorphotria hydatis]QDT62977.1 HDOD domain protein [Calycomorphotria hydatis]